jgi:transposase-like protein
LDGKYIKTRGFKKGAPFIYTVDYLTHDIPVGILARTESEDEFVRLFREVKSTGYQVKVAIGDDREGIKQALKRVYPYAQFQLCHVHYLRNIRNLLALKSSDWHSHFYNSLKLHVFTEPKTIGEVISALKVVHDRHATQDDLRRAILLDIHHRIDDLFCYLSVPGCPNNTNLIELYNSHLQARLKSIKGFKSFTAAKQWCNAYLIRRRTKTLTDCEPKFKHLNGLTPLQLSIKKQAHWPDILGVKTPTKSSQN